VRQFLQRPRNGARDGPIGILAEENARHEPSDRFKPLNFTQERSWQLGVDFPHSTVHKFRLDEADQNSRVALVEQEAEYNSGLSSRSLPSLMDWQCLVTVVIAIEQCFLYGYVVCNKIILQLEHT
jgi:hypothetical protein